MLDTPPAAAPVHPPAEALETLFRLNSDYIQSVIRSDVHRFSELLASDFLCSLPDGRLIDRTEFLKHTAEPYQFQELEAHDVNVRLMGDFAIVHARTTFIHPDGARGAGRYTDIWVKRDGQWRAAAAHVSRR
jgi:ketosteroid isomerase-like protein